MHKTLAVLLLLVCASCATLELPPPDRDPEVLALKAEGRPALPFSVAVAPVQLALEGGAPAPAEETAAARDMAAILETAGLFASVDPVAADDMSVPSPDADLWLRLRLHRLDVRFEGRNRLFLPNLLLWAAFVFPSWWVADETFSGRVDLEAVLVSARSGVTLGAHTSSVLVRRDLDDFQRGWFPLGIVLAPAAFGAGNYRRAGRHLLPAALRKAEVELARWIDGEVRARVDSGEILALHGTSFALCAGLSKYDSLDLHNLRGPARDAALLAQFLADPHLGGLKPDRVRLLADHQATRDALLDALEETLVRRPRGQDTALVYLAGYGAVDRLEKGPRHVLLAYESDPSNPASPRLALSELADVVSRSNAGRVVVVLDAGFAGDADARAASPPPAFETELRKILSEMVVRGRGLAILVERTGTAPETSFAPDLAAALAGGADLDGDGAVTAAELKERLEGAPPGAGTTVRVFGEDLKNVRIPFALGRPPEPAKEPQGPPAEEPPAREPARAPGGTSGKGGEGEPDDPGDDSKEGGPAKG